VAGRLRPGGEVLGGSRIGGEDLDQVAGADLLDEDVGPDDRADADPEPERRAGAAAATGAGIPEGTGAGIPEGEDGCAGSGARATGALAGGSDDSRPVEAAMLPLPIGALRLR